LTRTQLALVHGSLLITALLWGGNFTAIKKLLETLQPLDVVFVRALGAFSFFVCYLLWTRNPIIPMRRQDVARLILLGVIGITIMNLAMTYGQDLLPAALASLIVTSNPVWTVIFAALIGQERITTRTVLGISLAFSGFLIVLMLGSGSGPDFGGGKLRGVGLVMLAPFCFAIYTVLSKPLLARYPPFHVASYTAICGTVFFLTVPLWHAGVIDRVRGLDRWGWFAAFFASILAYAVSYLLWYKGLEALSPSQTAIYLYLVPVFGVLSAWLVLNESITGWLLLGGAIILTGVVITNTSRRARSSPRPVVSSQNP
jgi:drug/metabolite transporter (DMT)-like permease